VVTSYFVGLSYLIKMSKKRQSGANTTSLSADATQGLRSTIAESAGIDQSRITVTSTGGNRDSTTGATTVGIAVTIAASTNTSNTTLELSASDAMSRVISSQNAPVAQVFASNGVQNSQLSLETIISEDPTPAPNPPRPTPRQGPSDATRLSSLISILPLLTATI